MSKLSSLVQVLLAAGLALIVSSCAQAPAPVPTSAPTATITPAPTAVPSPSPSPSPSATPTPRPTPTATPSPTPERVAARVISVTDGDTIVVDVAGEVYKLRYIGVDCPEVDDPESSAQQLAAEATEANRLLVEGQTVYLEKDVSETDTFGRLLRYVYLADGTLVNEMLVRAGVATASSYPPDTAQDGLFALAQIEARNAGVGLWAPAPEPTAATRSESVSIDLEPTATLGDVPAEPPPATPEPATAEPMPTATLEPPTAEPPTAVPPTAAPVPTPTANCDPSYPTVCIPPPPPDLDCKDVPFRRFQVLPPDPHNFDGDGNGVGCEG